MQGLEGNWRIAETGAEFNKGRGATVRSLVEPPRGCVYAVGSWTENQRVESHSKHKTLEAKDFGVRLGSASCELGGRRQFGIVG